MKKHLLSICAIAAVALLAGVVLAGHTFLDWPANGTFQAGIGPVKIVAVDVVGSAVTNGTVILKRTPAGGTIAVALPFGTLTCTAGELQKAITNEVWIFADDVIERTGTATNARVRVILYQ